MKLLFNATLLIGCCASSAFGQVGGDDSGGPKLLAVLDLSNGTKGVVLKEARRTVLGPDYEAPPFGDDGTLDPNAPWRRGIKDSYYGRAVRYGYGGRSVRNAQVVAQLFLPNAGFPAQASSLRRSTGRSRGVLFFEWNLTNSGYQPTHVKAWLRDNDDEAVGGGDLVTALPPAGPPTVGPHRVFAQNVADVEPDGDFELDENFYYLDLQMAFNNASNQHLTYQFRYADLATETGMAPLHSRGVDMAYLWSAIDVLTGRDAEGNVVPGAHVANGRLQYIEFEFRPGDTGPWTRYRLMTDHLSIIY